jgi:RNA polymerase subunit RPABC4/transcription elongation factor Spt4
LNLFQKLKDGANKATDYAQQTIKTSKINTEITGVKREIERNNLQIGLAVYEAYKANDLTLAEEVVRIFSDNNLALEVEIAELEHEIEVIKNEKMCECGMKVSVDARYCPSCGKRFPYEPEVESAPEEAVVEVYRECDNCGMELEPDAKFCMKCGVIVK